MWQMFLNFAISVILSELLRPKSHMDRPKPAGIDQLEFPTASEDRAQPVVWGTAKQEALNMLWHGDLRTKERVKRVRTGMFQKEDMHLGYEYRLGMQMGLCVDGVDALLEVWAGETKIYSGAALPNTTVTCSGTWKEGDQDSGMAGQLSFHSSDTVPDAYIGTQVAINPNFKHMTYAVWKGPSTAVGGVENGFVGINENLRPLWFVIRRLPKVVRFGVDQATYNSLCAVGEFDANPAFCVLEAMCDPEWGAGVPPEMVDIASVTEVATELLAEGNGVSLLWDSPRPVWDIIVEMLKQCNGLVYTDLNTGLVKMRLLRASNTVSFSFNEDNVVRLENFTRSSADEATNCVRLPFKDIKAGFLARVAVSQDLGGIEAAGQVIPATVQYPGVSNRELAISLAARDLRMSAATLAKVTLTAALPQGTFLHPGDLVELTWAPLGLISLRMRVLQVRYSDNGKGSVNLELVQDIFLPGVAIYSNSIPALNAGTGSTVRPGYITSDNLGLVRAPYALSQSEADRGLVWVFAPDANTTSYDVAYFNDDSSDAALEWDMRSNIGFAARGSLQAPILQAPTLANLVFSVTSGNAATLKRYGSRQVFFSINDEMFQASGITLSNNDTMATLTGITRALWDTVPLAHPAYSQVVVWCDFVIDPSPLKTVIKTPAGATVAAFDGQRTVNVKARGRNASGAGALSDVGYMADNFAVGENAIRAALPYPPGNIKLAGRVGTGTPETGPGIMATGNATMLTWTARSRTAGGLSSWTAGDTKGELGVSHEVFVRTLSNGSSSLVASGTFGEAVNSMSLNFTNTPKGVPLEVVITPVKQGVPGRSQVWYFTLLG